MDSPLYIEIARMYAFTEQLPQAQSWVGKCLWPDGAVFTATLMLYGEAVLSVVRSQFPSATPCIGRPNVPKARRKIRIRGVPG